MDVIIAFWQFQKEDLVPSDIMAGLMLVYRKQEQKRHRLDVVDSGIAQNLRFVGLPVLREGRDTIFIGFKWGYF